MRKGKSVEMRVSCEKQIPLFWSDSVTRCVRLCVVFLTEGVTEPMGCHVV